MRFRTPALAALLLLCSVVRVSARSDPTPPAGAAPALTALNNAFRAAYADAKSRVLAASGPTLIVNGDNFALLREGRRVEANVGPRSTTLSRPSPTSRSRFM